MKRLFLIAFMAGAAGAGEVHAQAYRGVGTDDGNALFIEEGSADRQDMTATVRALAVLPPGGPVAYRTMDVAADCDANTFSLSNQVAHDAMGAEVERTDAKTPMQAAKRGTPMDAVVANACYLEVPAGSTVYPDLATAREADPK